MKLRVGVFWMLVASLLLVGCKPAGPRALWQGKRLIEKGRYSDAAAKLTVATSLLPTNANAWNYLGLARHYGGEVADADEAYRRALLLDKDLSEAHFNLGCLLLEEGKPDLARAELTAYILRRGASAQGSCKLGWAELQLAKGSESARNRALVAAEKDFHDALAAEPENSEALNGLGVVRFQRGHSEEALEDFQKSLRLHPGFAPAILNAGIVEQSGLRNLPAALAHYQEYLGLRPAPPRFEEIRALAGETERAIAATKEAANARVAAAHSPAPTSPPPGTNPAANAAHSVPALAANRAQAATNSGRQAPVASRGPGAITNGPRPAAMSPAARSASSPSPPANVVKTDATEAASGAVLKSVRESSPEPPHSPKVNGSDGSATPARVGTDSSSTTLAAAVRTPQKGFLQRINPLNAFRNDSKPDERAKGGGRAAPFTLTPGDTIAIVADARHYLYANPGKLEPGDRKSAQPSFSDGLAAQKAHSLEDAIKSYYQAIGLDPSYFDAYYNLGLTAGEAGEISLSLRAYEYALSVQPDAVDARYNFARTLKQVSCLRDAIAEFEKILAAKPQEARALLALGNIHAQTLHQNSRAREYYVKALEADPHLSEAGSIRYWLAEHP